MLMAIPLRYARCAIYLNSLFTLDRFVFELIGVNCLRLLFTQYLIDVNIILFNLAYISYCYRKANENISMACIAKNANEKVQND